MYPRNKSYRLGKKNLNLELDSRCNQKHTTDRDYTIFKAILIAFSILK